MGEGVKSLAPSYIVAFMRTYLFDTYLHAHIFETFDPYHRHYYTYSIPN